MQSMNQPPTGGGPIERIHEGMQVVDAAGEKVGRIELVSLGDPQAATTAGNEVREDSGMLGAAARAFGHERTEPDVPEPLHSRLVRSGYVKIDGPGLLDADRYVSVDRIAEVSGDQVRLSVPKDRLAHED